MEGRKKEQSKKTLICLLFIIIAIILFTTIVKVEVTSNQKNYFYFPKKASMLINTTEYLLVNSLVVGDTEILWTSSNPEVATIDSTTKHITSKSYGTTIISANLEEKNRRMLNQSSKIWECSSL